MDNNNKQDTTDGALSRKRGSGYTPIEDLLVCKAFIAASEDAIVRTSQKGKAFKQKMHVMYTTLTNKQASYDRTMMAQISSSTRSSLLNEGIGPGRYDARSPDSVFDRFKVKISPEVSKFLGVVDTTPMDSGTNEDDYFNDCLVSFKNRYGREFEYVKCYEYLKDKVKYTCFPTKLEEEEKGKNAAPAHPKGQKMTKKAIQDATFIKQAIDAIKQDGGGTSSSASSVSNTKDDAASSFYKEASAFLSATGEAVKAYVEKANDAQMMEMLSTPEKKQFATESAKLRIAEMRAKRRRLEGDYSVPNTIGRDTVSPVKESPPINEA